MRDRKKKKNGQKDAKNKFCKRPTAPGISRRSPIQSTNRARRCLTSVIGRERLLSTRYGRMQRTRVSAPATRASVIPRTQVEECQKVCAALARRQAAGSTSREVRRVQLEVGLKVE